jgi:hypothetical protein
MIKNLLRLSELIYSISRMLVSRDLTGQLSYTLNLNVFSKQPPTVHIYRHAIKIFFGYLAFVRSATFLALDHLR